MVQAIKVLVPPVELPGGSGLITIANEVVNLTDEQVAMIDPNAFNAQPTDAHNPSGSAILQNMGFVGQGTGPVAVQAAKTANAPALTSTQQTVPFASLTTAATAYNQLQVDVAAVQTALNNLLAALQVSGGPQKSS